MRWNHVMKGIMLLAAWAVTTAKAENITFAEANVKTLCVANWDKNTDGELSTEEAAAVTSLGTVFREKTNIKTFNELRYFTGLTSINSYAFYKSTIEKVTFPTTVTAIGEYAFSQSNIGTELVIPRTVKTIGNYAYYSCKRLNRVVLQEGVETVGWHTFSGPIAVLSLPTTLTHMSSMAIDPYGATIPQGDYFYVYTHSTIPANIDDFAFYPSFAEGHLVVPPGCIDAYKAVAGWSHFGQYLELGDVNRDGTLDDTDLENIISYVDGTEPEDFYADMADINGDGDVDDTDVSLLRNYLYPPTYLLGDTNDDGVVNVQDQINLITYLLGRTTEVFIQEAADVNGDRAIDTLDAIGIIEIILGRR